MGMSLIGVMLFVGGNLSFDLRDWRALLWGGLCLFASVFSFRNLKAGQPLCWLSWDGNFWSIPNLLPEKQSEEASNAQYEIHVHLDFQSLLFVSLTNTLGQRQWFWLRQNSFPDRWHGFRCAVYSRSEDLSS